MLKRPNANPYDLPPELINSSAKGHPAVDAPYALQADPPPRRKKTLAELEDAAKEKTRRQYEHAERRNARREKNERPNHYRRPIALPEETTFRHAAWEAKRDRVHAALVAANTSQNTVEAFENCGAECSVEYEKNLKKYRLRASYCKNRWCEPCMRAKGNLMAANLRKRIEENNDGRYRFFTLTLRHSDAPLARQVDRLFEKFKQLRTTPLWKDAQHGGCTILEVKWNPDRGEWHPHLHLICEGTWMSQHDLSNEWLRITGDSHQVKILALKAKKDVAFYLTKYVSKGCSDEVWYDLERATEFVQALKGRRMCGTFGSWRGFALLEKPKIEGEWHRIDTLSNIHTAACRNETWAIRLFDALVRDCHYNPHKKRAKQMQPVVPK